MSSHKQLNAIRRPFGSPSCLSPRQVGAMVAVPNAVNRRMRQNIKELGRPHVKDILEVRKGSFDFLQFFVESHGVDRGQCGLLGLDDLLSLALRVLWAGKGTVGVLWTCLQLGDRSAPRPLRERLSIAVTFCRKKIGPISSLEPVHK